MKEEYWFHEGCFILEMHNTDADHDCSIARARVLPGHTTEWHQLRGTSERYVILAGQGVVEIGEESPREVGVGDIIQIPPLTRQRISNHGDVDLVFLAICTPRFSVECYEAFAAEPR